MCRRIEPRGIAEAVRFGCYDARAELEVPEYFELTPGIVVVEAHEPDERGLTGFRRFNVFDEPLAVACVDDLINLVGMTMNFIDNVLRSRAYAAKLAAAAAPGGGDRG